MKYSIKDFAIQVVIVFVVSISSLLLLNTRYFKKCDNRVLSGQVKEVYDAVSLDTFTSIKTALGLASPMSIDDMQTKFQQPIVVINDVNISKTFSDFNLIHKNRKTGLITLKFPVANKGNEGYVYLSDKFKKGDYVDYCQSVRVSESDQYPEDLK